MTSLISHSHTHTRSPKSHPYLTVPQAVMFLHNLAEPGLMKQAKANWSP